MEPTQVVAYRVDDDTVVQIEIAPVAGFVPAGTAGVAGRVQDAAEPALKAAKVLLERVKELSPDGVEVKFGVKVTGTNNWLVARAAAEGSFEVTLTWQPERRSTVGDAAADSAGSS